MLLKFYQRWAGPWTGKQCRFLPTCSQYAIDALGRYGLIKGCYLTLVRLAKCHPFHAGGSDPVN